MADAKKGGRFPGALKRHRHRSAGLGLVIGALAVLVMLAGLAMIRAVRMGQPSAALKMPAGEMAGSGNRFPSDAVPPFEIFPEKEALEPTWAPLPEVHVLDRPPQVAIIIDDLGYDWRRARAFIELGFPLTFSILPNSPFEKAIADAARAAENEIMLHLPMEPVEYPEVDPGPGALLMDMTPEDLVQQVLADIETLPDVRGVNNHMGSRMTSDRDRMTILFSILKEKGLFFIDSRTTPKSTAGQVARAMNLDFAHRDVFLDHIPTAVFVENQLDRLLAHARRHGTAIGIAHPNIVTYRVLRDRLPRIVDQAVLVPASAVIYVRQAEAHGVEIPAGAGPVPDRSDAIQ